MALEHSALTALANIEERVRRYFRAVGRVGLTFKPDVTPVVIVGDLTGAGSTTTRGRQFMWSSPYLGPHASSVSHGFMANGDIVIDSLWFNGYMPSTVPAPASPSVGTVIFYFSPAAEGFSVWGFPTLSVPFCENSQGANDLAPIAVSNTANVAHTGNGRMIWGIVQQPYGNTQQHLPCKLGMLAGDKVLVTIVFGQANLYHWGFTGHTY